MQNIKRGKNRDSRYTADVFTDLDPSFDMQECLYVAPEASVNSYFSFVTCNKGWVL